MAVSLISTNCCIDQQMHAHTWYLLTHLQLIQIAIELLKALEQSNEVGRSLGIGDISRLNHTFLIDQGF